MNLARLVFPALRWKGRSPDAVWPEVRSALDLGVGGFVVFGGSASGMRVLSERARNYSGYPLLFSADLERGGGQQLEGATPLPPAAALAGLDDMAVRDAACITAEEAAAAGIGWVLAPVADLDVEPANPIVGTRSFGASPAAVSGRVGSWIAAAQAKGVIACAKHYPGHGRTTVDSHAALPVVTSPREMLEADLAPFRAAVAAGVRSVMMAHVSYPALDPSGMPASMSEEIIGQLRSDLGFDGIVATDALIMGAVSAMGMSESAAAVAMVHAGCDAVLYPSSPQDTIAALEAALGSAALARRRVVAALERIERAATGLAAKADDFSKAGNAERGLALATDAIRPLRGAVPQIESGQRLKIQIIDDDLVVPAGAAAGPGSVPRDRQRLSEAVAAQGGELLTDPEAPGALQLVALFSEVRGWKGRSDLAPETVVQVARAIEREPEATVLLFGHPRLAEQLPSATAVICAWTGDPPMQEALAARLFASASA